MNTLRRVGLVVVSCIILLLALLCPVSAASFIQEDDLLINDDLMLMPNGTLSNGNVATTDLASSPNYPQFNPNMIPWKDAPDYVKEVLTANTNDMNKQINPLDFDSPVRVPFVCVRVNGSNAILYVGWNLCVLYLESSNRPVLGRLVYPGYDSSNPMHVKMLSSTLYRATYNLSDMSLITPWYDASSDFSFIGSDSTNNAFSYTSALTTPTGKYDLYFYGANYVFWQPPEAHTGSFASGPYYTSSGTSFNVYFTLDLPSGFQFSNNFFYFNWDYVNTYCQYFVPKTMPDVNTGVVGDHSSAEDALVNQYNPDNLTTDLSVDLNSTAVASIFNVFDMFISNNSALKTLIITMLTLGFIALLLNR